MKRIISLLLSAALLLSLLPACNSQGTAKPSQPAESDAAGTAPTGSEPAEPALSCMELVVHINSLPGSLGPDTSTGEVYGRADGSDAEQLSAYIQGAYGLEEDEWREGYIFRVTGASAFELAVLRFADEAASKHGEDCLKDYLHSREGDFTGYAPEQAKMVSEAAVCRRGTYVGLFICRDSAQASVFFEEALRTGEFPESPEPTAEEILNRFLEDCGQYSGDDTSHLERVGRSDPDRLKSILDEEYGLGNYPWTDAAIARGADGNVFEIAAVRIDIDQRSAMDAVEILNAYLDTKEEAYAQFPAQAELLNKAIAAWNNGYIALLVCNNPEMLGLQLGSYLGHTGRDSGYSTMQRHWNAAPVPSAEPDPDHLDRVKFTPPNKDDMSLYDTSAIRAAWEQDDPAKLSEYERDIYDAAKKVLNKLLNDGMSDYEKEFAVYEWVVNNVNYDWTHQDYMRETPRESFTPYGGLVNHTAVCLGYATTFQLLMDLAGVECITVTGAAFNSEEDHAWNMVRLNGNWYCLDVTWDANGREQLGDLHTEWRYFNVTSDHMANSNHQWDYAGTPEATAEDQGR